MVGLAEGAGQLSSLDVFLDCPFNTHLT